MSTNHLMIDLETLDNRPSAVIRSIGAVWFGDGVLGAEFYTRIDPQSCVDYGLSLGVSTIEWWLKQGDAARAEMCKPGKSLPDALASFSEFVCAGPEPAGVWGNGASFDNVILANAYDACRVRRPWKFWADRCYRTVKAAAPSVEMKRDGTHHNALDDARDQARHLMAIWAAQGDAK